MTCTCPPGHPFRHDYVPTIVWRNPASDGKSETQTIVKKRMKDEGKLKWVEPKIHVNRPRAKTKPVNRPPKGRKS